MLILKSQSLIYLGENIYWCKNYEKYTNWWDVQRQRMLQ